MPGYGGINNKTYYQNRNNNYAVCAIENTYSGQANLTVAFVFFHQLSIINTLGEQAYVYPGVYVTLNVTGPGKYSVDQFLSKRKPLQ